GFFSVGEAATDATPLALGLPLKGTAASALNAAMGVQDEDGMLVWVELAPDVPRDAATVDALDGLLARLGCSVRMAVPDGRALLGGAQDLAGDPAAPPADGIVARLVRAEMPAARKVFDTPIVSPNVWQPLQAQRVRYFKKPEKRASAASASDAGAPSTPTPATPSTATPK